MRRPEEEWVGKPCEKCGTGKYQPVGPNGWERLRGIITRTYHHKFQCDNESCGHVVQISGAQTRQWASVKKMQGSSADS